MLAALNHELRTSMNGTIGMLELLLDTGLSDSQREFARTAQRGVEDLFALLASATDLALAQTGQLAMLREPVSLQKAMRQAYRLRLAEALDKDIELIPIEAPAMMLDGDAERLSQLVACLLACAIRASRGAPVVTRACHGASGPDMLCVSVETDADDALLASYRAIMEQPEASPLEAIRRHGALGVELALCSRLASLMNGSLGVERIDAQRARLTLSACLPARSVAALDEDAQPAARSFAGCRVLVADDNPVNRQAATRMLEKIGCTVDCAIDGAQAVSLQQARPYALILLDCQMPGLDGWQAAEAIRASEPDLCRTPIIALTACSTHAERERCRQAGMDDFISKPLHARVLKDILHRWAQPSLAASGHAGDADDIDAVSAMFGDGFQELAALYRKDSLPRIAALREAWQAGDARRVASVAHAFAGSSVSIGAAGLSALCRKLEAGARRGALDEFDRILSDIELEYARVSAKLQALAQGGRAPP